LIIFSHLSSLLLLLRRCQGRLPLSVPARQQVAHGGIEAAGWLIDLDYSLASSTLLAMRKPVG
jgi:hypothetical protein